MANRFKGELNHINPSFLVSKNGNPRVEAFFLGLGVIFNDLKGILLFEKLLLENYEKPLDDEVSAHAGDYGGVLTQIQKLMVSTIHEFFIFLKKNSDIFVTSEFKEVLSRLSKYDKRLWDNLVAAAHGKLLTVTDLLKAIVKIRSNIAFHYDHSGKILRSAYESFFFGEIENPRAEFAYYSIGPSIELTRFYFSDAAVQEALFIAAGKKMGEDSFQNPSLQKYNNLVKETVEAMSEMISSFLKSHIQSCRNRPH